MSWAVVTSGWPRPCDLLCSKAQRLGMGGGQLSVHWGYWEVPGSLCVSPIGEKTPGLDHFGAFCKKNQKVFCFDEGLDTRACPCVAAEELDIALGKETGKKEVMTFSFTVTPCRQGESQSVVWRESRTLQWNSCSWGIAGSTGSKGVARISSCRRCSPFPILSIFRFW